MSDDPVLRLLAPLSPMYVGRASPGGLRAHWIEPARPQRVRHDGFEPCVVEAIVTVDAKGRVPWPTKDRWLAADIAVATVVEDGTVEIRLTEVSDRDRLALDPRGRLQLHRSVLRAAGIAPGDRLAVVRVDDPARVVLTSPRNLAIRSAPS